MCVIVGLPKGIMVPWIKLKSATLNNADGFGVVIENDKKFEIIKQVDAKGNDPEEVQKILEKFKDHDRYLHLRYATAGATSEDNAHPFTVLKRGKHQIEFMHNGSINSYRPSAGDNRSDTHRFAAEFLSPLFERLKTVEIEDPFITSLIEDKMTSSSRGLLVSNEQGACFLGKWKTIKSDNGEEIPVSNDDYFDDVKSFRRQKYEPQKTYHSGGPYGGHGHGGAGQSSLPLAPANGNNGTDGGSTVNTQNTARKVVDIASIHTDGKSQGGRFIDPKEFEDYMETGESVLTDEAITFFSWLSTHELNKFATEKPEVFARLFECVVARFGELVSEVEELHDIVDETKAKHERATKHISSLTFELNEFEKKLSNGGSENVE